MMKMILKKRRASRIALLSALTMTVSIALIAFDGRRYYCLASETSSENSYKCQYFLFSGYKCDPEQFATEGGDNCAGNRLFPIDPPLI